MNSRKCPVCASDIIGRKDKKYCSEPCRHEANSLIKSANEKPILDTNKALRKNRTILKTLCPEGKATVRKEILIKMGYDVTVFTSIFVTQQKQVYYISYDYGFTPLSDNGVDRALIIHKQDYMKALDPWKFVKR